MSDDEREKKKDVVTGAPIGIKAKRKPSNADIAKTNFSPTPLPDRPKSMQDQKTLGDEEVFAPEPDEDPSEEADSSGFSMSKLFESELAPAIIATVMGGLDAGMGAAQGTIAGMQAEAAGTAAALKLEREAAIEQAKVDKAQAAVEVQQGNLTLRDKELAEKRADRASREKIAGIKIQEAANKEEQKQLKENKKLEIPGVGLAATPQEATEGKNVVRDTTAALSTLTKIQELRKLKGTEFWDRKAVAKGKSLAKQLQLDLKGDAFAKLGVLQKADLEFLEEIVASDPLKFDHTGATEAKFDEAFDFISGKANTWFDSRGLTSPFGQSPAQKKAAARRETRKAEIKAMTPEQRAQLKVR